MATLADRKVGEPRSYLWRGETSLYAFPLSSLYFQFFSLSLLPIQFFHRDLYLRSSPSSVSDNELSDDKYPFECDSFFFFFFLKFASHRIHPILLAYFALAKIYELFRFTKIFENAICDMPVGKHFVSTNYSVRKKLHARLHGINLAAIDVLLVTIPEDIPFPRMGPRVWRRSISYLCAA